MLITLICVAAIIGGFICSNKCKSNNAQGLSICIEVIGIIGITMCIIAILFTQIPKGLEYEKMLHRKEVIEYRIDTQKDFPIESFLYGDIVEFNNHLREVKYYANNPWTSWFYNADIASIDYIDYNKGD